MGLVILSFVLSFFYYNFPILILVAYPALLVGFPIWSWGRGASRHWTQAPKTDDQVNAEFKGLNTKYTLFHHVVLDKLVLDHVLISPDGILVVEMKEGGGLVTCKTTEKGDRWAIKLGILERIARFGEGGLGNPPWLWTPRSPRCAPGWRRRELPVTPCRWPGWSSSATRPRP